MRQCHAHNRTVHVLAYLQTLAGLGGAWQYLPLAISEVVKGQLGGDLGRGEGVDQVLLVGHDQQGHAAETLLVQQLLQLHACLLHATAVGTVNYVDQSVGLVKVVSPVRADGLLACTSTTMQSNTHNRDSKKWYHCWYASHPALGGETRDIANASPTKLITQICESILSISTYLQCPTR
jgi:hypothetical protein